MSHERRSAHAGRPINAPLYGLDEPSPEWDWPQVLAAQVIGKAIADLRDPQWSRQATYFLRSEMMRFWCDVLRLPRSFVAHSRGER